MALTEINKTATGYFLTYSKNGVLENKYKALKNLIKDNNSLDSFRTANLKVDFPINIEAQPSFDGSVNLILNDDKNTPKLINTRFSTQEDNSYIITDHKGNKDSNLYTENQLDLDTRLYKTINKIPTLTFNGIEESGSMKCGSYNFYFKFSDNDGNETDFIAESGIVTCHIGGINKSGEIRMGMENEDSKKMIKFTLSDIDTSYDFVNVYYTRTTSDNSQEDILTAYFINNKYPIKEGKAAIDIYGFEEHIGITLSDININYEIVKSTKTQTQCQNMLFFGNIEKENIEYEELADLSLQFIPYLSQDNNIGNIQSDYQDYSPTNAYEYYNVNNIYNFLGYWPEEYYRLGIVYLMNDFTLSPVFNIRGGIFNDKLIRNTDIHINKSDIDPGNISSRNYITVDDEGFINKNTFENSKGVVKLNKADIIGNDGVNPIGIKIKIDYEVNTLALLKQHTKGFFIVRQERLPTIYAQGVIIGKTKDNYGNIPVIRNSYHDYLTESFLTTSRELGGATIAVNQDNVENKAALMPEVELKESKFKQLFTSSEYVLTTSYNQPSDSKLSISNDLLKYYWQVGSPDSLNKSFKSLLTYIKRGLNITTNGVDYFSSKAGQSEQAWDSINPNLNWKMTRTNSDSNSIHKDLTESNTIVRGEFGSYVGLSNGSIPFGTIFNVRPSNYEDTSNFKYIMFKTRIDSSNPYFSISDRISWDNFNSSITVYRGDCYICNFTHRMINNFQDPDLPTNTSIVDRYTWLKNYAVKEEVHIDNNGESINKVLLNYKIKDGLSNESGEPAIGTILEPDDAKYATAGTGLGAIFSKSQYKEKGASKINRSDVNAVSLGHWVTFKVMANSNLSMRDIDFSNTSEESLFGYKRSFYPLKAISKENKLPDSDVLNGANNVTLSKRANFTLPDVPTIKNKFDTRILYSDINTTDAFKNGYRVFQGGHYRDYTKTYGSLVDLKEWYGNLFCTMEHGCLLIPVNERAIAAEGQGGMAYINTSNVLPENPKVISDLFGSTWQDSIIKTKTGIYGIDTVAKKIWKFDGSTLTNISDLKVQRFLNENITLKEADKSSKLGIRNVKTHYNKNKGDIIFTFVNTPDSKEWSLCYNENLQKFITFYSWIPSYSANINNIFFSLNNKETKNILNDSSNYIKIWKHGASGIYDNVNRVYPTKWYGNQEIFEFEFVVTEIPTMQKIFNNLRLISNKAEPNSFEFEVVGETYDFYEVKDLISWINFKVGNSKISDSDYIYFSDLPTAYKYILSLSMLQIVGIYPEFIKPFKMNNTDKFKKLPFIKRTRKNNLDLNSTEVTIISDDLLSEDKIHTQQLGNDIKKYGRLRGNMQYLEDAWDIEIKPINFKYAYLSNGTLSFTTGKEARIRDKYVKIRVKYSGTDLAIVQGIKTSYTQSFA